MRTLRVLAILTKRQMIDNAAYLVPAVVFSLVFVPAVIVAVLTDELASPSAYAIAVFVTLPILICLGPCILGIAQVRTDQISGVSALLSTLPVRRSEVLCARLVVGICIILIALTPLAIACTILWQVIGPPAWLVRDWRAWTSSPACLWWRSPVTIWASLPGREHPHPGELQRRRFSRPFASADRRERIWVAASVCSSGHPGCLDPQIAPIAPALVGCHDCGWGAHRDLRVPGTFLWASSQWCSVGNISVGRGGNLSPRLAGPARESGRRLIWLRDPRILATGERSSVRPFAAADAGCWARCVRHGGAASNSFAVWGSSSSSVPGSGATTMSTM